MNRNFRTGSPLNPSYTKRYPKLTTRVKDSENTNRFGINFSSPKWYRMRNYAYITQLFSSIMSL